MWAAPIVYVYVTIVGMFQSWFQFNAFGINVFEFSGLNDFLLAAFRKPLSFLVIIGTVEKFLFFFERSHQDGFITPISNVILIEREKIVAVERSN